MEEWEDFIEKDQLLLLEKILAKVKSLNIAPTYDNILNVFNMVPEHIKVVIIGQNPYFSVDTKTGELFANGHAFAINKKCSKSFPSLKNIITKAIRENVKDARNGVELDDTLSLWIKQGVFLFNSALTTEIGKDRAHIYLWQYFTDYIIGLISSLKKNVVFMLWGANALSKRDLIDTSKHLIIGSSHPSFQGCNQTCQGFPSFNDADIFKKCNEYLIENGLKPIKWV